MKTATDNNTAPRSRIQETDVPGWHRQTDVLIVGGGGAGISAAIEAADAGARVTVLEAASAPGGSTAMAGGLIYLGGGTPTQLACGFIMNPAMVAAYAPRLALGNYPNGNPNDTGGGINMGMGAGGAVINMHEGFICTPFYPPHQFLESIIVNENGERFINEDVYHGRLGSAILDRPKGRYYLIIDSRHFEVLKKTPLGGYPVAGTGESIAELSAELVLPEDNLAATLNHYNTFAGRGEDPLFHKHADYLTPLDQPPYAAYDLSLGQGGFFATMTFGGLDTLPTGEVLTNARTTIPGLYAAGRNSAGLPRCAEGYASGMSIGDATFFGRQAGLSAARRKA